MKTLAKAGAGSFGLLGSDSKYTPRPPITETPFSENTSRFMHFLKCLPHKLRSLASTLTLRPKNTIKVSEVTPDCAPSWLRD